MPPVVNTTSTSEISEMRKSSAIILSSSSATIFLSHIWNLFSLAIVKSCDKTNLELSVETFYKTLNNLIAYKEGAILFGSSNNWQEKIETGGIGKSYGAEFLIKKRKGATTGWLSYYISRSERQFNSINQGKPYLYKYDRTHDFSIVFIQKIRRK